MNNVAFLQIVVDAKTSAATAKLLALDKQMRSTTASSDRASASIGAKLGKAAKWGGAALAVGVAAGLVKSVKAANEFESSFAEVRKTVNTNEKGFDRLEKGLRRLARTIPVNVNDLNDLAGQAGALGIKSKDLVRFTKTAAELGIATDLSANDAANALARLSNIMGTSSKDFRRLGSSLVALGNDGASTEREIADMALRLAATGKQVGLTESQVLGFSSALASVGIEAEAGGSAFSRAFSLMSESVATGNSDLAGFAQVAGQSAGQFSKLFDKNAAVAMVDFVEGLGRIKQEGGNALVTLKDLDISDVRLRNALLSAAGAGKMFREQIAVGSEAWRENNALTKEAQRRYDTTDSKMQDVRNEANDLAITIGQKLQPAVQDMAGAFAGLIGTLNDFLQGTGDMDAYLGRIGKKSEDVAAAVAILRAAWKVLGPAVNTVIKFVLTVLDSFKGGIRATLKVVRGFVQVIGGLLRGDWKQAWQGARNIVSGSVGVMVATVKKMVAPLTATFRTVRRVMSSIFGSAWDKVESIFRGGVSAVMGLVNSIIDVLNKIPGVDIGKANLVGDEGSANKTVPGGHATHRQRGGPIFGGKPSGDSIPAMLERGEYVLNRNAVSKVGRKQLDALNFGAASRFQVGGPVGMLGGGVVDAVSGAASAVGGAAAGLAGKALGVGAGWFIKKLPKPDLPVPFSGVGPWLIEHVTDWIKDHAPGVGGSLGTLPGTLGKAMALAQQHGLTITSTTGGTHAPGSYHYQGRAFDASNGTDTPQERAYFLDAAGRWGSKMLELFYDPIGWYIKNGAKVPGAIGGHSDHVHTAMQRGGLVRMLAEGGYVPGIWAGTSIDRMYSKTDGYSGAKLKPYIIKALAEYYGLPGVTMEQITQGESMGHPGVDISDPPGRSRGLYAINDHYNGQYGTDKLRNPIYNTWVAAQLAKAAGGPNSNIWHGSSHVTGWDLHYDADGEKLRNIARSLGGSGDAGMSEQEKAKAVGAARRKNRQEQVEKLLAVAKNTASAQGKKGAYWRILDLFARYGDFDYRKRDSVGGGVAPPLNQAADFLHRAASIASIADPNRGAGRLYSLVGWLQDNVELTGRDADEALAGKLADVKSAGSDRAKKKRKAIYSKIAGMSRLFRFTNPIGQADKQIAWFGEKADIAEQMASNGGGPGGSDYTDAELGDVVGFYRKVLGWQTRKKNLLESAIPAAQTWISGFETSIAQAQKNPKDAWKIPGFKQGLKAAQSTLSSLKSGKVDLLGLTGGGGELFQTQQRLLELGATTTAEQSSEATRLETINSILGEQLNIAKRAAAIANAQTPIFQQFMPKFHTGGDVPGHGDVMAMVRGGETVYTSEQNTAIAGALSERFGAPIVNVYVNGVKADQSQVRVEVQKAIGAGVSQGRRAGSNRKMVLPK